MPECPYIELVPFNEEDAAYFFGRERNSDLIVANLNTRANHALHRLLTGG